MLLKKLGNTIFGRMFIPVMSILLLQCAVFIAVFFQGGIVERATDNAYAILNEQVVNRLNYIEAEMVGRWSSLAEPETLIREAVRSVLAEQGAQASDIATDAALNAEIEKRVYSDVLYTLRRNGVTGAFLVLDGPAFSDVDREEARAGVYLRDLDPSSAYSMNDEDILLVRGAADIARGNGIPLDSYWETAFRFSADGDASEQYFFAPLDALRSGQYDSDASADFGYWAPRHRLGDKDTEVISYSIPITVDGEPIGVFGVDITISHLQSYLYYDELHAEKAGIYLLCIHALGEDTVNRVASNGPMYRGYFGDADELAFTITDENNILNFTASDDKTHFLANVHALHLYNTNTPFVSQQWLIAGMMREADLLVFAYSLRNLIYLSTLISLVLGVFGVFIASNLVSRPISRLAKELEQTDTSAPVSLEKLGISEIDLLSVSIENLSREVAENASKMSKMMELMNLPIGLYEKNENTGQVFCSHRFLEFAGEAEADADRTLAQAEFERLMEGLSQYLVDPASGVYMVPSGDDDVLWLRFSEMRYGSLIVGALSDITRDMREKQKIEYERDFDVLTSLYNRRGFQQNVETLFENKEYIGLGALVMWDIDNLKYVNDTYGHTVGDGYICAFADVLRRFDTSHSLIARRSGDEFYAFLYGYEYRSEVEKEIREVWKYLQQVNWALPDGNTMRIRVSAGIAWYPKDAETLDELVKYADFAMYNVKHTTKGRMKDFDMEIYRQNSVLINGTEALNQLIDNKLVHYALQPIFSVRDGSIFGYELLMRSDMRELPGIGDILRLAGAQSKLGEIEELTFFEAMRTYAQYVEEGKIPRGTKVFINSIGGHILSSSAVRRFEKLYGSYLSDIVVEITENQPTPKENVSAKQALLEKWQGQIALDDYGSGYSNESSLLSMSPDIVKVDISIIEDIDTDENKQDVLENLVSYAKPRGIRVLAEGVETEAEARQLLKYDIDFVQGYFFAKPNDAPGMFNDSAVALLRREEYL